jgi:hypothetical protein
MVNRNKNKLNQPPTGEGKKQSPKPGKPHELYKRSEVLQAQRDHPEENIGTMDEEMELSSPFDEENKATRAKAGR